ncbi:hypothetical protein [Bacillus coahuilensis]|uniref:hypothetical protein n=1 Tax=Bacillus coahuilensis TaxID=408580 RepID=UPI000185090C|nr:hypothetical protein [Bacillus coahuilensis]
MDLRKRVETEERDVEKLERLSLTNFFATVTGKKDEKLSKEKEEAVVARHQLEKVERTKKEIDEEITELIKKLDSVKFAEQAYQDILLEKESLIKSTDTVYTEEVFALSEKEGLLKAYVKEVEEAIKVGEQVQVALSNAISDLEKAESWGTLDMFGGGTVSGLVKHQHMDQAEHHLHQAQKRMREFQKELVDVNERTDLTMDISGLLVFADFFFDGFFMDFIVQGKITESLKQTKDQYRNVAQIINQLDVEYRTNSEELQTVQQKKQRIVEGL